MVETYTIPLKKEYSKVPIWRRSKRAMDEVKAFLAKHTKAKKIILSKWINEEIWKDGAKRPPQKIRVKIEREGEVIRAELPELPERVKRKEERAKKEAEKLKKKTEAKNLEEPKEKEEKERKEEPKEKEKEEKERKKELKKQAKPTKKQTAAINK